MIMSIHTRMLDVCKLISKNYLYKALLFPKQYHWFYLISLSFSSYENYSGGASSSYSFFFSSGIFYNGFSISIICFYSFSPRYLSDSEEFESFKKLIPIFLFGSIGEYLPYTNDI